MSKASSRHAPLALAVILVAAIGAVAALTLSATAARTCNPKNRLGYVSKEPCEICVAGEGCFNAIPMIEQAQTAAANGDLAAAISTMERAVRVINSHRLGRIQRWDNLAELYCLRAAEEPDKARADLLRRDGLAMIAEFRCGVRIQTGATTCALPSVLSSTSASSAWGLVPNPRLTPMCYESACQRGFQSDDEEEFGDSDVAADRADWESHYEEMDEIAVDARNVDEIEQLCQRVLQR